MSYSPYNPLKSSDPHNFYLSQDQSILVKHFVGPDAPKKYLAEKE